MIELDYKLIKISLEYKKNSSYETKNKHKIKLNTIIKKSIIF